MLHQPQAPGGDVRLETQELRMPHGVVVGVQPEAAPGGAGGQHVHVGQAQRQRLFRQHVQAQFERFRHHADVRLRGRQDVYGIGLHALEQFGEPGGRVRNAPPGPHLLEPLGLRVADAHDLDRRVLAQDREVVLGDVPGAGHDGPDRCVADVLERARARHGGAERAVDQIGCHAA